MPNCNIKFTYNANKAKISSNGPTHYKQKHPQIALSLKEEEKK
jgi:hypothetical protein